MPKQYRHLGGKPILARTLQAFIGHPQIHRLIAVIHPDDQDLYQASLRALSDDRPTIPLRHAFGGASRQDSVRHGLEALSDPVPDIVLIHDAARPFVSPALISRAIEAGHSWGAAVPGTRMTDTIKIIGPQDEVVSTPERAALRAI